MVTHKHLRQRFAKQMEGTVAGSLENRHLYSGAESSPTSNMAAATTTTTIKASPSLPLEVSEESDHEEKKVEFPPGTRILKFFQRQGWIEGVIEEHNDDKNEYIAFFPDAAKRTCLRDVRNLVRLAKIKVGSRVAIWWPDDKCYYHARVTEFRPKRHEAFKILYDDDEREWIDFRKHKFELLEMGESTGSRESKLAPKTILEQPQQQHDCDGIESSPTNTKESVLGVSRPILMDEPAKTDESIFTEEDPAICTSVVTSVESSVPVKSSMEVNVPHEVVPVVTESTSALIYDKFDVESVSLESEQINSGECAETEQSEMPILVEKGTVIRVRCGADGSTAIVTVSDIVMEKNGQVRIECVRNTKQEEKRESSDDCSIVNDGCLKIERMEEETVGNNSETLFDTPTAQNHEVQVDACETRSQNESESADGLAAQDNMPNAAMLENNAIVTNGTSSDKVQSKHRKKKEECKNAPIHEKEKQVSNDENPSITRSTRSKGNNDEDASESNVKRQRNSQIEAKGDVHNVTVGTNVEVWWADDAKYYAGVVTKQRNHKKSHFLIYDDGDKEWIDFHRHKFRIIDRTVSHGPLKRRNADVADVNLPKKWRRNSNSSEIEVGKRVAVWWAGDRKFYKGTVTKHDEKKKRPFYVEYDDGDREWIDLQNHRHRILHKESC